MKNLWKLVGSRESRMYYWYKPIPDKEGLSVYIECSSSGYSVFDDGSCSYSMITPNRDEAFDLAESIK